MAVRVNVRLAGGLGVNDPEKWSIGLNYGFGAPVLGQTEAQAVADAIAALLAASATPLGTLANGASASTSLKTVDVYGYPAVGPSVSHAVAALSPARSFTGAASAPPQTTSCITLQTAIPGRSYRGRVYWPQLAPTMDSSLKSSTAKGHASGLKTLNDNIETILQTYGAWQLVVYSAKLDVVTPVTSLRSGDVLDTQRRRRDALAETFTTVTV